MMRGRFWKTGKVLSVAIVLLLIGFMDINSPAMASHHPATAVLVCGMAVSILFGVMLLVGYACSQALEHNSPAYRAWTSFHVLALAVVMSINSVVSSVFDSVPLDTVDTVFVTLFALMYACLTALLVWRVHQWRNSRRSRTAESPTTTF